MSELLLHGQHVTVLEPAECSEILDQVLALKAHWVQRHPEGPYFTFGASNHWDLAMKSAELYKSEAQRLNPILWKHFKPLYERLTEVFSKALGSPAIYGPEIALPGFHIFLGHPLMQQVQDATHTEWFENRHRADVYSNAIHFDSPHLLVDFGAVKIDEARPLSFTLAIDLPAAGSGLYLWDVYGHDGHGISDAELMQKLMVGEKEYHPYHIGQAYIHSGLQYHQIAKLENLVEGERRITVQGHAVFTGQEWILYW